MASETMAESPECAFVAGEVFAKLRLHCRTESVSLALSRGVGFVPRPDKLGRVLLPDASVVIRSRLPDGRLPITPFAFAPDLAVYVTAPGERIYDTEETILELLDAGTAAVWLAKPFRRRINVWLPDGSETSYGPADELPGAPVLPGFRLRVGDMFPPPAAGR